MPQLPPGKPQRRKRDLLQRKLLKRLCPSILISTWIGTKTRRRSQAELLRNIKLWPSQRQGTINSAGEQVTSHESTTSSDREYEGSRSSRRRKELSSQLNPTKTLALYCFFSQKLPAQRSSQLFMLSITPMSISRLAMPSPRSRAMFAASRSRMPQLNSEVLGPRASSQQPRALPS